MVKITLKKRAFEIENPEEFIRLSNAKADAEDKYYAKILIPTKHIPLERVLRTKFQVLFNREQRKIEDQELHDLQYYIWYHAREKPWQVKRMLVKGLRDNQAVDARINFGLNSLLVGAGICIGIIVMLGGK